jgi:capsular polysaccharide transport system ATP-binding protein
MSKSIILHNINKVYQTSNGNHTVLNNINLKINEGESVGILGRNGAGKSTLVRIISGAEAPTQGRIERNMSISWPLAFSGGFQGSLTGIDNIRFICRIYNSPIAPAIAYVEEFSELGSYLNEPVKMYSSGMRARLAFGISMAIEFDCYLIDEVVAVGDDRFKERSNLELFQKRKDKAKIIVSHSAPFVKNNCDHAVVLLKGVLHQFDHVDEAFKFYHSSEALK